ncbi:hypothetical protein [Flavobacterium sp.]|uniref:hypothetical protein n=1 Tax=Flavobacterium sp. TaxID=239 RepID=UPI0026382615|nr:hypothetical protein [Flavobacterium sp.]
MKHILTLIFILLGFTCIAQEEELTDEEYAAKLAEIKEELKYKEFFRLYYVSSNGVGDNVIAEANGTGTGIGMGVTFGIIGRVHIIGSGELSQFIVIDKSVAGNANNTNMGQLNLQGMYKFALNDYFEVNPGIGFGYIYLRQKRSSQSLGIQEGFTIIPTVTIDFKLDNIRFFTGVNYCHAFLETNTHPDYKDFFGRVQMLNIMLGFKL